MAASNVRIERSRLGTITRLGVGGQGVVYAAPSLRMQYASALVYKEYKPHVIAGLDVTVLEAMPAYLETLQFSDGMELLSLSAWPCRLVEEAGAVRGFVMPAIPNEFFLDLKKASGVQRGAGEFQHLLNGESFLVRRQIPLTDRDRFELLADAARGLAVFHRHGIAVGDLSPKNLLFSLNPHAKVFFIDCDAMRFQGRSVMPQLETPGWEVHAVNPGEELGTEASDIYKLALLALRLFAGDQSTTDPSRLPSLVPKEVRQLVSAGLSKSPAARPSPDAWVRPLLTAAASAATAPPTMPQPVAVPPPMPAPTVPLVTQPVGRTTAQLPVMTPNPAPISSPATRTAPTYIPPGRTWWERTSGGGKVAVVGAVIAAIAIAGNLLGSGGSGSGTSEARQANLQSATTAASGTVQAPTTTGTPSTASGGDVPPTTGKFPGRWEGVIEGSFSAIVEIAAGPGGLSGTLRHPTLPCDGVMRLVDLTGTVAIFDTQWSAGSNCIRGGKHRLTLVSDDHMRYEWLSPSSARVDSGNLARK